MEFIKKIVLSSGKIRFFYKSHQHALLMLSLGNNKCVHYTPLTFTPNKTSVKGCSQQKDHIVKQR